MKVTMLDDRKGWRNRVKTIVDISDLSDQWSEVKKFIENMKDVTITIIVDVGGHGKLTIYNERLGNKIYDLFVWKDKVEIC